MLRAIFIISCAMVLAACNAVPDMRGQNTRPVPAVEKIKKIPVAEQKKIVDQKKVVEEKKHLDPIKKTDPKKNSSSSSVNAVVWHQVIAGETLFSIAKQYGVNYKTLAQDNHLAEPFAIYIDQRLAIQNCQQHCVDKKSNLEKQTSSEKKQIVLPNKLPQPQEVAPAKKSVENTPLQKQALQKSAANGWIWPVKGKVIKTFSLDNSASGVNKGIDIAGKLGAPVKAVAPGTVVYSGHGLAGYGNLIILKHDNNLLSAYAHNRRLLVHEGNIVKAGQKIAEIGSTGTSVPALHFEIRRAGQPVNPLELLSPP